jgi:pimeloyl-ACP methyl ester carboxylesterase
MPDPPEPEYRIGNNIHRREKVNRISLIMAGVLMLFSTVLPGCSDSEPAEYKVVSEEINWEIGETTVYATITRPESGQGHPAVVFVPGSGPTDRDWNSPLLPGTNGSAKLLAEELAREGYVTLRYDKRFAGEHASENLPLLMGKISMQSHIEELQGAVDMLRERSDVDSNRIFALANSEGVFHTVNYQLQAGDKKLAGMILTGAPGQSMGELARTQIAAQLAGAPNATEIMEMYDKAIDDFVANGTMEPDEALPAGIRQFLQSLVNPVNMPFTQEVWTADIAPDLKNIKEPVLIIIGKKDIQVNWEFEGGILQAAAEGQDNISFAYPDNANHVLKYEAKAREDINPASPGYNAADTVLDAETLQIILDWLNTHS